MSSQRSAAAIDSELSALLERSGMNIQRAASSLRDLLIDYPERAELVEEVQRCEHRGDEITRELIHHLKCRGGSGLPFGTADGHALATALDDIVDFAEETADALVIYGVEAPMEQAVALSEVLVEAATQVAGALDALTRGTDLGGPLNEIHRLESEGDRLLRKGLASLFANGIDPMLVIRWKDIFESLESSIDACQAVAHVIEGISLRSGQHSRAEVVALHDLHSDFTAG